MRLSSDLFRIINLFTIMLGISCIFPLCLSQEANSCPRENIIREEGRTRNDRLSDVVRESKEYRVAFPEA